MKGFFSSDAVSSGSPTGLIPRCGACGLYKQCESPKMTPHGEGRRKVLIVGETPGTDQDDAGTLLVGKHYEMVRDTLDGIGVDMDQDVLLTNSLICHTPDNATPDLKQIGWCRPNLVNTINEFKPRVIVTLGRSALVSVLMDRWKDVDMLERWIGWKIPLDSHWLCPTFHPSYLLKMKNDLMTRRFKEHLAVAFDIDKDPPTQSDWKEHIEVLYDEDEIHEALREFRHSEWLAFDYETNCLKPEYPKATIYSCAVSDGNRTISYPWRGKAVESTGRLLKTSRPKKIASNLKMEEKWTRFVFGHGVRNWGHDTMIAAHCLDNRMSICSIKFQAFVRLGVAYADLITPYLRSKAWYNRIHHLNMEQLLLYGGMDAILEFRVAMAQRQEMGYE